MSVRIQVILDEKEAAKFRQQAQKESISLSRWLREAGEKKLEAERQKRSLKDLDRLKEFFRECDGRDQNGKEPDWNEHKELISEGYAKGLKV